MKTIRSLLHIGVVFLTLYFMINDESIFIWWELLGTNLTTRLLSYFYLFMITIYTIEQLIILIRSKSVFQIRLSQTLRLLLILFISTHIIYWFIVDLMLHFESHSYTILVIIHIILLVSVVAPQSTFPTNRRLNDE